MKLIKAMMAWAVPCLVYAAAPAVSNVTVAQDDTRLVTISYTLEGAGAIVTMDVLTNGVSIGRALYANATGDVNVKVPVGNRTITWQPRDTWPDQRIRDNSLSVKLTVWALDNPPDYMAVDLTSYSNRIWYVSADDVPGTPTNDLYKCDWMLFRRIHAEGVRWRMGINGDTTGKYTPHTVVLTNDYYMAVFEGTFGQRSLIVDGTRIDETKFYPDNATTYATYEGLRGAAASGCNWPTDGHAVAADSVIGKFRTLTGLDTADLPTEAEWEYACRAGSATCYHWGSDSSQATFAQYDWRRDVTQTPSLNAEHGGNGNYSAQNVGLLKPNAWGLYDMHGNCFELCLDWYSEGAAYCVPGSEVVAPVGPTSNASEKRTCHSGSWMHDHDMARAGNRLGHPAGGSSAPFHSVGYRLSCSADLRNLR